MTKTLPQSNAMPPIQDARNSTTQNANGRPLPEIRHSKAECEFDLNADKWFLAKGTTTNLRLLRENVGDELLPGLINTLAFYAERRSARTTDGLVGALRSYVSFAASSGKLHSISTTDLINFRNKKLTADGCDRLVIILRPFLITWSGLGYVGVPLEVTDTLKSWTLKSSPIGEAVLQLDPNIGPLDPAESAGLRAAVMSAYASMLISHEDLTASLLINYTGRRPIQIAHLKIMDLDDSRQHAASPANVIEGGRKMLLVHIPRAKQKNTLFRRYRKSVEVIPALWAALGRQRDEVLEKFNTELRETGFHLQTIDQDDVHRLLPLFASWAAIRKTLRSITNLLDQGLRRQALKILRESAASGMWHRGPDQITDMVQRSAEVAGAVGRTGEPLKVDARRLRYTKGTDAARAGYGEAVIAELLDHSNTHSAHIYTQIVPEHAIPINKAMALAILPLAQLFRGKLVDRESAANGGGTPSVSRILFKGTGAATCGSGIQCGLGRLPRPCYTCGDFQPWLDGPNEAVLEELLQERQARLDILGDPTMVGVEDHTIIAVVNVIQRCQARRAELESQAVCVGGVTNTPNAVSATKDCDVGATS